MDTLLMLIGALVVFFGCVGALLYLSGFMTIKVNDKPLGKDKNGRS